MQNPTHTFENAGTFAISLTAGNSSGSSSLTKTIVVTEPPPVANFSHENLQVTFHNSSTPRGTSWLWNFGDGQTSTLENPVHQYSRGGRFRVSLTATNDGGSNQIIKYINL